MEEESSGRVFERYNFPYDSESVREIFSNVNPDLVIFLGALMIPTMTGAMQEESLSRFTADLTNLLSAYAFNPKGRFVYLSSEAVYGRSYMADIHETEPASRQKLSGDGDPAGRKYLQELPRHERDGHTDSAV